MSIFRRSFFYYPIFPYFLGVIAAALIVFYFPQLREWRNYFLFGVCFGVMNWACFCSSACFARKGNVCIRGLAFFCFCVFWFFFRTEPAPISLLPPSEASFSGEVCEVSKSSKGTVYGVLRITDSQIESFNNRKVWFTFISSKYGDKEPLPNIGVGDNVSVRGILRSVVANPPLGWGIKKDLESEKSFNKYLLNRFIFYKVFAVGSAVKVLSSHESDSIAFGERLADWINKKLSVFSFAFTEDSPSSKILRAMILGDQSNLTTEQKAVYKRTGTMHLFAVSGFNIGIVGFAICVVCMVFAIPFMWRPAVVLPILFLYVLACGLPPSAVRAFFMITVFWLAYVFSRGSKPENALMLSAVISALISPEVLYSAGFQLSYCVVGALVLFSSPMYSDFRRVFFTRCDGGRFLALKKFLFSTIVGGLCVSLGASIVAMPISAYWFGMFSLSGIFFSPVFVILATFAVIFAMLGLALPDFLTSLTNSCAASFVWCMQELAEFVSNRCSMVWNVSITSGGLCVFLTSAIFIMFVLFEKFNVWLRFSIITASVFGVMFLIWIF